MIGSGINQRFSTTEHGKEDGMTARTYSDVGVRTKQGAYWMLLVLMVLGFNTIGVYYVRTHETIQVASAAFWILCIGVSTTRALRALAVLEEKHAEPDDAMKLAFQLAVTQPIVGIMPLVLLWLP